MWLLDTNICSAALKHHPKVVSRLTQLTGRVYLPFVVSAELYFGLEKRTLQGHDMTLLHQRIEDFHAAVDVLMKRCSKAMPNCGHT